MKIVKAALSNFYCLIKIYIFLKLKEDFLLKKHSFLVIVLLLSTLESINWKISHVALLFPLAATYIF